MSVSAIRVARVSCDARSPFGGPPCAGAVLFRAHHALSVTRRTSWVQKGSPSRRSKAPRFRTSAQRQLIGQSRGHDQSSDRTATLSSPVSKSFQSPSGRSVFADHHRYFGAVIAANRFRPSLAVRLPAIPTSSHEKYLVESHDPLVTGANQQDDTRMVPQLRTLAGYIDNIPPLAAKDVALLY